MANFSEFLQSISVTRQVNFNTTKIGGKAKMINFAKFLKTSILQSISVTRQVNFKSTKINGKCQNAKIQNETILSNFQPLWVYAKSLLYAFKNLRGLRAMFVV